MCQNCTSLSTSLSVKRESTHRPLTLFAGISVAAVVICFMTCALHSFVPLLHLACLACFAWRLPALATRMHCVCVCVAGRWRHVSRWIRWQLWHWRTSNRLIQRFWRVVDDAVDCYSSFWQNKFERSENSQRLFQPKIIIMNENKTHRWICTTQTLRSPMASAQTIGTRMKSREPVWSHTIPFLITLFTEFQSIMILLRVFGDDWCHCSRIEAQNASRWQNENRKLWFNVCVDVSMGWSGAFFRSSRDSKHATSLSSSSLSPSLCLGGRHVIQ